MKNLEADKAGLEHGIHTVEVGVTSTGLRVLSEARSDRDVKTQLARWHNGPTFDYEDILEAQVLGPSDVDEYEAWMELKVKRGARLIGTFIHTHWACTNSSLGIRTEGDEYLILKCAHCQEFLKLKKESIEELIW